MRFRRRCIREGKLEMAGRREIGGGDGPVAHGEVVVDVGEAVFDDGVGGGDVTESSGHAGVVEAVVCVCSAPGLVVSPARLQPPARRERKNKLTERCSLTPSLPRP